VCHLLCCTAFQSHIQIDGKCSLAKLQYIVILISSFCHLHKHSLHSGLEIVLLCSLAFSIFFSTMFLHLSFSLLCSSVYSYSQSILYGQCLVPFLFQIKADFMTRYSSLVSVPITVLRILGQ